MNKSCVLTHPGFSRDRLRHVSSSHEYASRKAFCHRTKLPMTKKEPPQKNMPIPNYLFWKWFYFLLSSLVELEHDSGHSRHHDIEDRVLFPFN